MYEQGKIKISLAYLNLIWSTVHVAPKNIAIKSLYVIPQLEPLLRVKFSHATTTPFFLFLPLYFPRERHDGEHSRGGIFFYVQYSVNGPSTFKNTHRHSIGSHFFVISLILRPSICSKNGWD